MRHERGLDILEYAEPRKDVLALERAPHAHAAEAVRRNAGHIAAVQHHLSGVGAEVPCDQVEERGLARAVRADDRADPAARDIEAHAADRAEAVEGRGEV